MMFYQAMQLKKEIEKQRQELFNIVKLKGTDDPNVLALSQKLDLKVIQLQRIISKAV